MRQPAARIEGGAVQVEQLVEQAAVEVGGDLRDRLDLDALPLQPLDLVLDVGGSARQIVDAARARSIRPGNELGIAGDQAEQVDVLEHADIRAVRPHREPALVVARHHQQGVEDKVAAVDRDTSKWQISRTGVSSGRRSSTTAFDRFMPVTMPMRSSVAYEQRIVVALGA